MNSSDGAKKTKKNGAPAYADPEVGASVRITLSSGGTVSGLVYTVDPLTKTIVLCRKVGAGDEYELQLVAAHAVAKVDTVAETAADADVASLAKKLPTLDPKTADRREREALETMEAAMAQLNPNAPPEGQALFDALHKTMDCTWLLGNSINVLGQVRIDPPYQGPDDCHSLDGNRASLERIRKVVVGLKKKIVRRSNSNAPPLS